MNYEKSMLEIETIKGKKQAKIPKLKKQIAAIRYPILETFTPGCIGHGTAPDPITPTSLIVQDFLVDSTGLSKGGESINPLIQVGLNASKQIIYTIAPEACKRIFKVSRPAGIAKGYFGMSFGRTAVHPVLGGGGFYEIYPATITFNGLSGTAPVITYANFFITNGVNNSFYLYITGEFSKNFSFTDIKIVCNYPLRSLSPQFDFYRLLSYSRPFTIHTAGVVCYALFGYKSHSGKDLGPIIKLL